MYNKTVLIAGGSGLIGRHLSKLLKSSGYEVKVLTRNPTDSTKNLFHWDPSKNVIDNQALTNVSAIVNLAGAGIAEKLWTPWRRRQIINSRVFSTRFLVQMLNNTEHNISVIINASATGIYGNTGLAIVHEDFKAGSGFLSKTCLRWEEEANNINQEKTRHITLRIGNVLANDGGIVPTLMLLFKFRIAPIFGDGSQYFSWIHIDDLCCMISECINNPLYNGVYNAVSPGYLSYTNLITLIKQLKKGWHLTMRIPAPLLKISIGGMAQLLNDGNRSSPDKIIKAGFSFKFPSADKALKDLLRL